MLLDCGGGVLMVKNWVWFGCFLMVKNWVCVECFFNGQKLGLDEALIKQIDLKNYLYIFV